MSDIQLLLRDSEALGDMLPLRMRSMGCCPLLKRDGHKVAEHIRILPVDCSHGFIKLSNLQCFGSSPQKLVIPVFELSKDVFLDMFLSVAMETLREVLKGNLDTTFAV